ncbi:hypothetical protein HGG75_25400 [Ochrobactrum pseudogrignonense]|nr:hypothetical protein [Brucella pseudogrignonensis]
MATAALSVKAEGRINISAPAMQLSLVWMLCGFGLLIALSLLSLLWGRGCCRLMFCFKPCQAGQKIG